MALNKKSAQKQKDRQNNDFSQVVVLQGQPSPVLQTKAPTHTTPPHTATSPDAVCDFL